MLLVFKYNELKHLVRKLRRRPYSLFVLCITIILSIFSFEVLVFDPNRLSHDEVVKRSALTALNKELRSLLVKHVLTVEEFSTRFLHNLSDKRRERCELRSLGNNASMAIYLNISDSEDDKKKPFYKDHRCWNACNPRERHLAIVIPFRQRESHLRLLLDRLHPLLQAQKICYQIFVVEQFGNATFNKGKLMNAGFNEAMRRWYFECVIFHDVDLLPLNKKVPYWCPAQPRHISVGVDKWNFSLPYQYLVGGVLGMSTRHFLRVNGFSNMFWGWGAEDDDMFRRIEATHLVITRPNPKQAQFVMLKHVRRKPSLWPLRQKLLILSSKRYRLDGLNSLNYELISEDIYSNYTHLMIDLGAPPDSAKVLWPQ